MIIILFIYFSLLYTLRIRSSWNTDLSRFLTLVLISFNIQTSMRRTVEFLHYVEGKQILDICLLINSSTRNCWQQHIGNHVGKGTGNVIKYLILIFKNLMQLFQKFCGTPETFLLYTVLWHTGWEWPNHPWFKRWKME